MSSQAITEEKRNRERKSIPAQEEAIDINDPSIAPDVKSLHSKLCVARSFDQLVEIVAQISDQRLAYRHIVKKKDPASPNTSQTYLVDKGFVHCKFWKECDGGCKVAFLVDFLKPDENGNPEITCFGGSHSVHKDEDLKPVRFPKVKLIESEMKKKNLQMQDVLGEDGLLRLNEGRGGKDSKRISRRDYLRFTNTLAAKECLEEMKEREAERLRREKLEEMEQSRSLEFQLAQEKELVKELERKLAEAEDSLQKKMDATEERLRREIYDELSSQMYGRDRRRDRERRRSRSRSRSRDRRRDRRRTRSRSQSRERRYYSRKY